MLFPPPKTPLTLERLCPVSYSSLFNGRTRLSSLPRSLPPGIVLLECIHDHGPYGLSSFPPNIARFSVSLPSSAPALAAKTQPYLLSPDLYGFGQPRTGCGRTNCTSIQDAIPIPATSGPPSAVGPVDRVNPSQIGFFWDDLHSSPDSPGTGTPRSPRQAQVLSRYRPLQMERGRAG